MKNRPHLWLLVLSGLLLVAAFVTYEAGASSNTSEARSLNSRVYQLEQKTKNLTAQVTKAQRAATNARRIADAALAEAGCVDGYVPTSSFIWSFESNNAPYQLTAFDYDAEPDHAYKLATLADECASTSLQAMGSRKR